MLISELLQIFDIIEKIALQDLPLPVTMRIAKCYRQYFEHYDMYIQEKDKLVSKYGDDIKKFNDGMTELLNRDVELNKIDIGDAVYLKLSVIDLIKVSKLIN